MLFKQSHVNILDNSGARSGKVIGILKKRWGSAGDSVIVSVRGKFKLQIQKGDIFRAVVVRTKKSRSRFSGIGFSFNKNGVVLIKKSDCIPLSNRISRTVFREVKRRGFDRIVSLSKGML